MLKITTQPSAKLTKLVLEGQLAGPWVEEMERCWSKGAGSRQGSVEVDLSGVTFIDPEGKALLTRMWQQGVDLRASGCLTRCIVEEIIQTGRGGSSPARRKGKR
jgi:ABC-type transporter Mla MlaB component